MNTTDFGSSLFEQSAAFRQLLEDERRDADRAVLRYRSGPVNVPKLYTSPEQLHADFGSGQFAELLDCETDCDKARYCPMCRVLGGGLIRIDGDKCAVCNVTFHSDDEPVMVERSRG